MTEPSLLRFPDGFLWGTATSSHQVEGDDTNTDWWAFERVAGGVHDGTNADRACEWWRGRAEEDLDRAAALGTNAVRISLSWGRLEPREGRFDAAAFERYRAILSHARARGLAPMVTLHHFTFPRWLAREGGALAPRLAPRFARFCRESGIQLGDLVSHWATLNEPNVLALMAYHGRAWPPAMGSFVAGSRAMVALARMHAAGFAALKAVVSTPVGLVLNLPDFSPLSPLPSLDGLAARAQERVFSGWWLKRLNGVDFLGINYYGRYRVRFDPRAAATMFGRAETDRSIHTAHNDWGDVAPDGLTTQLVRAHETLGVPVMVTENGVMDAGDGLRQRYLPDHVRAVHAAIVRGADVRGYFHWSLVDNFEWAEGWDAHFGLFALDPSTQTRTARPSAALYAAICRANGVTPT